MPRSSGRSSYSDKDDAVAVPKGGALYEQMLKHAPPENRWFMFGDVAGVSAISNRSTPPTREQLIEGWMLVPQLTPTRRDSEGKWQYAEKRFTREEAEAKVDALLGRRAVQGAAD